MLTHTHTHLLPMYTHAFFTFYMGVDLGHKVTSKLLAS